MTRTDEEGEEYWRGFRGIGLEGNLRDDIAVSRWIREVLR